MWYGFVGGAPRQGIPTADYSTIQSHFSALRDDVGERKPQECVQCNLSVFAAVYKTPELAPLQTESAPSGFGGATDHALTLFIRPTRTVPWSGAYRAIV